MCASGYAHAANGGCQMQQSQQQAADAASYDDAATLASSAPRLARGTSVAAPMPPAQSDCMANAWQTRYSRPMDATACAACDMCSSYCPGCPGEAQQS